jgi:hypothetical protein
MKTAIKNEFDKVQVILDDKAMHLLSAGLFYRLS